MRTRTACSVYCVERTRTLRRSSTICAGTSYPPCPFCHRAACLPSWGWPLAIASWIYPLPFAHLSIGGWSTPTADAAGRADRQLPDLPRVWPENHDQPRDPRVTA